MICTAGEKILGRQREATEGKQNGRGEIETVQLGEGKTFSTKSLQMKKY